MAITNTKAFVIVPGLLFSPGYGLANVDKCHARGHYRSVRDQNA